jgi:hypothetical protein
LGLIENISPGLLRLLTIAAPYAPAITDPILVVPGGDISLEPIRLSKPASLKVVLDRAQSRTPFRGVDTVVAQPLIGGDETPGLQGFKVEAPRDEAYFPSVMPGMWRVAVLTDVGSGHLESFGETDVLVPSGTPTTVRLNVAATTFEGQVFRRERAVSGGRVELMPAGAAQKPSRTVDVFEDGTFEAVLSEGDEYNVFYAAPEERRFGSCALRVTFVRGSITEVHLADGTIEGVIVDGDGHAVAEAAVTLTYLDTTNRSAMVERQTRSDSNGAFRIDGLSAGSWFIEATDEFRTSEIKQVKLGHNSSTSVRLVLKETTDVTGTLLGAGGEPAPGIDGFIFFEQPKMPQLLRMSAFRTDDAGEFTVRATLPQPRYLHVQVLGHERGTATFRVRMADRFELRLPAETATVALDFAVGVGDSPGPAFYYLLHDGGGMIPLSLALSDVRATTFARGSARSVVLLNHLAPGTWRLYPFTVEDRVPWFLYGRAAAPIAVFAVVGGERRAVAIR